MTATAEHVFADYMRFPVTEENPWHPVFITECLVDLGATNPQTSAEEARRIQECYSYSDNRVYHAEWHGVFVGQRNLPEKLAALLQRFTPEEAAALLAVTGVFHDAVYKQVDVDPDGNGAWSPLVQELVGSVAYQEKDDKGIFRTFLKEIETSDDDYVTKMVAHIFKVGQNGIIHNRGGNEFDSALAIAKFLEAKGAPLKIIMAAATITAATVPFKPAMGVDAEGNLTDGHMGELADVLTTAQLRRGDETYQPDWVDVNDIMLLSVHLTNRDVAPIFLPDNFESVVDNGRMVKAEEAHKEPETLREFTAQAGLGHSAGALYRLMASGEGDLLPSHVPHFYMMRDQYGKRMDANQYAYPPLPVYDAAAEYAETNIRMSNLFLQSHEVSSALVNCFGTLIGNPDAKVRSMVHAASMPTQLDRPYDPSRSHEEVKVFHALFDGSGQRRINHVIPERSPIAGLLLAALGSEGMALLSARIQTIRAAAAVQGNPDPFCDRTIAQDFANEVLRRTGAETFYRILQDLQRIARYHAGRPDRARRLASLAFTATPCPKA